MGVRHRFLRREGFGRDDEEGRLRIEFLDGFDDMGSVNVGNEVRGQD